MYLKERGDTIARLVEKLQKFFELIELKGFRLALGVAGNVLYDIFIIYFGVKFGVEFFSFSDAVPHSIFMTVILIIAEIILVFIGTGMHYATLVKARFPGYTIERVVEEVFPDKYGMEPRLVEQTVVQVDRLYEKSEIVVTMIILSGFAVATFGLSVILAHASMLIFLPAWLKDVRRMKAEELARHQAKLNGTYDEWLREKQSRQQENSGKPRSH